MGIEAKDLGLRESSPKFKILEMVAEGKWTEDHIAKKLGFKHVDPVRRARKEFDFVRVDEKTGIYSFNKSLKKAGKVKLSAKEEKKTTEKQRKPIKQKKTKNK